MALTSGQQERLRRLLEDELRKAGRTALEHGASPDELADSLAERRHALAEAERRHAPSEAERPRTPDEAEQTRTPAEDEADGPQRPGDAESGPGQA